MSKEKELHYDCLQCPSYCCSTYVHVAVTNEDIQRLADSFGMSFDKFVKKFTDYDEDEEHDSKRKLKRQRDPLFGNTCKFLDLTTRKCSVHLARPDVCRTYPVYFNKGQKNHCVYYDMHKVIQREQGKEFVPMVQIISLKDARRT